MKASAFPRKYGAFLLILVLCAGVFCLFGARKEGLFIDEIYSYGLSNSDHAPYLSDLKGGEMRDVLFTRQELDRYLTVDGDGFAAGSVYYNQTKDVHPPLYYWVMNFVSSLVPGSSSKWIGLGVNLFFYLLTLAAIFHLALLAFGSADAASAAAALYGLSRLALSAGMLIRMYMMMTFFTVLLALLCLRALREPGKTVWFLCLTPVIMLGLLTQYYFVFYAFFLCLAADVVFLCRKNFRAFWQFSLFALLGVALSLLAFPAALQQIFRGNGQVVGGASVLESLRGTAQYGEHLRTYLLARYQLQGIGWVLAVSALLLLPFLPRALRAGRERTFSSDVLIVLVPAIPAFLTVAILSPVQEFRYIYNLAPFAALAAGGVLSALEKSAGDFRFAAAMRKAALCLVVLAALWSVRQAPPDHLFPEMREYDARLAPVADKKCVYVTGYSAPPTQDLLQLRQFDDFLTVSDVASPAMQEYLDGEESYVLYIDVNPNWSSGYDADLVFYLLGEQGDYSGRELLYRYDFEGHGGLSETWLVRR